GDFNVSTNSVAKLMSERKSHSARQRASRIIGSQTQVVAEPHAADSEADLADDVPERGFMIAAVPECEGVEAKTGERREAAEDPDEHERSGNGAEMQATSRDTSCQQTDHQTADHVDGKDRPRDGSFEPMRQLQTDKMTRH